MQAGALGWGAAALPPMPLLARPTPRSTAALKSRRAFFLALSKLLSGLWPGSALLPGRLFPWVT